MSRFGCVSVWFGCVSVWLFLGLVVSRFTGERFNLKPVLNVICMICCNGSFTLPETDSDSDSFPTEMGCRDWSLSVQCEHVLTDFRTIQILTDTRQCSVSKGLCLSWCFLFPPSTQFRNFSDTPLDGKFDFLSH